MDAMFSILDDRVQDAVVVEVIQTFVPPVVIAVIFYQCELSKNPENLIKKV